MRANLLAAAVILGVGCTPAAPPPVAAIPAPTSRPSPAAPIGPKAGDKLVYPTIGTAFVDIEAMQEGVALAAEASRLRKAGLPDDLGEAGRANQRKATGTLWKGDLIEVIEVGDDYAVVDVLKDARGDPGKVHGFVKRWW